MFTSPRKFTKWACLACACATTYPWSAAQGQNLTMQTANPDPIGLRSLFPANDTPDFGITDGVKGAFGYGVWVNSVYDSNFFITENNRKSELTTNLSPYFSWVSDPEGGARYSVAANYTPIMRAYLHNSELNGFDHVGDVSFRFEGAKTLVTAYAKYNEISGNDRLAGGFVSGSVVNTGAQASYRIAPRTSFVANWLSAVSQYDSGGGVGSQNYKGEFGALWAYTERLSFGPTVRYTQLNSDNIGTRDAWGLALQAEYLAGERIRFRGSLGMEYAKYPGEDQSNTVNMTGELNASYVISKRWTWSNSILYATVPSPTDDGYVINNLEISSSVVRTLLRANLEFGMEYNISNYESVGTVAGNVSDENNLRMYVGYNRNIISERVGFNARVDYILNEGREDWSQVQLTTGLSLSF